MKNKFKIMFKDCKILDYYDGPLIFSFNNDGLKLAYLAEMSNDSVRYMIFSTDPDKLDQMLSNRVSIREFMVRCEAINMWELDNEWNVIDWQKVSFFQVIQYIPDSAVFWD